MKHKHKFDKKSKTREHGKSHPILESSLIFYKIHDSNQAFLENNPHILKEIKKTISSFESISKYKNNLNFQNSFASLLKELLSKKNDKKHIIKSLKHLSSLIKLENFKQNPSLFFNYLTSINSDNLPSFINNLNKILSHPTFNQNQLIILSLIEHEIVEHTKKHIDLTQSMEFIFNLMNYPNILNESFVELIHSIRSSTSVFYGFILSFLENPRTSNAFQEMLLLPEFSNLFVNLSIFLEQDKNQSSLSLFFKIFTEPDTDIFSTLQLLDFSLSDLVKNKDSIEHFPSFEEVKQSN